jgi:hypothetical protein
LTRKSSIDNDAGISRRAELVNGSGVSAMQLVPQISINAVTVQVKSSKNSIRRCELNGRFLNNYFLKFYYWARKLSCNIAVKEGYRGEITQPTNFRRCIASGAYISGMGWPSVPCCGGCNVRKWKISSGHGI